MLVAAECTYSSRCASCEKGDPCGGACVHGKGANAFPCAGSSPEEDVALLQEHMSRCLEVARKTRGVLRASGHATRHHPSIALLKYVCSADDYLSYAARVLSRPPIDPSTTLAPIDGISSDTVIEVLKDLRQVVFNDLSEGRGREDVRYGSSDYHVLLCNIINTFNTYHKILYPLLHKSDWILSPRYNDRFDDLRLLLEKEKKKNRDSSSLVGARLRYRDTILTPNDLKRSMASFSVLNGT